jgi:lysophospholipase L1-like esterase
MGLAEIGWRLFTPYPLASRATYQPDPLTIYAHKPNSAGWEVSPVDEFAPARVSYNAAGFRGPELNGKKNGEVRVALLGDSITEGRQVAHEATFAAELSRSLNVSIINAGVSAYTTTTANLMLRNRVLAFAPDIVIYFFFANDYADNFVYGNYSQYPEILKGTVPSQLIQFPSDPEWRDRVAVMSYFSLQKSKLATAASLTTLDPTQGTSQDFRLSLRNVNKADLNPDERGILEFTHLGLLAMDDAARSKGARFIVAIVPSPPQVGSLEWRFGKQRFGYGENERILERTYQDRIVAFGAAHGIPVLDLLPNLTTARGPLFYDYDGHLTPAGHSAVAKATAEFLKERVSIQPRS